MHFKWNCEYHESLNIKDMQVLFYQKFTIFGPWSKGINNQKFFWLLPPAPHPPASNFLIDACKRQIIKVGVGYLSEEFRIRVKT